MAKRPTQQQTHPISLAELARRAGVNRSSITRLAQGALRAAVLADGRIDAAHDAVAAWARGKGISPRLLTAGLGEVAGGARRRSDAAPDSPPPPRERPARARRRAAEADDPEDDDPTGDPHVSTDVTAATITNVREMTLGQVAERYKTETRFLDVLKSVKVAEEIRYKFLDNEEQEGRLVPREVVEKIVFGGFDELFRKLLGDMPKTLTSQVAAYAKADEPNEKGEVFVRDLLGSQIRAAKDRMVKRLEAL